MGLNLAAALIDDFDCRAFLSKGLCIKVCLSEGLYIRAFVIEGDCIPVVVLEDEKNRG